MRAYWSQGGASLQPALTGAGAVMDCADLLDACEHLGVALPFQAPVFDVGCGTGRLASLCAGAYFGADISPSAVEYCGQHGRAAVLVDGPWDLAAAAGFAVAVAMYSRRVGWVTMCSLLTHVDAETRRAYLRAAADLGRHLLADVIPGPRDAGTAALWTVPLPQFERELEEAGWRERRAYSRVAPDGTTHVYFRAVNGGR